MSEDLQLLVATGETMNVEFKSEDHDPISAREFVEAVVSLSNRANPELAWHPFWYDREHKYA